MAHRHADRRGDRGDFRCGRASLRREQFGRPRPMGGRARLRPSSRGERLDLHRARRDQSLLGAGACHLHVRMDGEIRRRARRAHRHSRRRRCPGQAIDAAGAQARDRVRAALRRVVHRRDRHARRHLRPRSRSRPGIAGARMAELDHLSLHSARLVPDVLPISAGDVALFAYRFRAASKSRRRL